MPPSVWRRVRARVHLSLTPVELSNPVRFATKKAFSSLLMRYSPELGGAVVAHIGPVELCGPPVFVDASPFAHVAAIATLLVFAPKKGTELLGVVTHVGPDHLGLSVLSAFHAVLPIEGLADIYRFESKHTNSAPNPMWKRIDGADHVTIDRQIRFVISDLKPTRTGLFQIIASLDTTLRQNPSDSHPLGLLSPEREISLSTRTLQQGSDNLESHHSDVLQLTQRSSAARANDRLKGDELLAAGNDMLGDALTPTTTTTTTPISALRQKKRRRAGTEPRSVSFEYPEKEMHPTHPQDKQPPSSAEQPLLKTKPATAPESSKGNDSSQNRITVSEKNETSDRKKRKKDKKKKKKKKTSSRDAEQRNESDGSARRDQESCPPSMAGNKTVMKRGKTGDERDSSLLASTKQEQQIADEGIPRHEKVGFERGKESSSMGSSLSTTNVQAQKDTKEQERERRHSSGKKEGKKSKKKRRERDISSAHDGKAQSRTEENAGERGTRMAKDSKVGKQQETSKSEVHNGEDEQVDSRKEEQAEIEAIHRNGGVATMVKTEVVRDVSMRRDAERAVELGPMEDDKRKRENGLSEGNVEDDKGLVQTQAEVGDNATEGIERESGDRRKKKKKKRRRYSEGGADDEQELKRKKKREKRMSQAMEIEGRRSLR